MIFDIFKNNFNLKKYIFKTVLKIMLYSRRKKIMLLLFTWLLHNMNRSFKTIVEMVFKFKKNLNQTRD